MPEAAWVKQEPSKIAFGLVVWYICNRAAGIVDFDMISNEVSTNLWELHHYRVINIVLQTEFHNCRAKNPIISLMLRSASGPDWRLCRLILVFPRHQVPFVWVHGLNLGEERHQPCSPQRVSSPEMSMAAFVRLGRSYIIWGNLKDIFKDQGVGFPDPEWA